MLSYELCNELKSAGLDQKWGGFCEHNWHLNEPEEHRPAVEITFAIQHQLNCNPVYCPTLSELIEACGNNSVGFFEGDDNYEFCLQYSVGQQWLAGYKDPNYHEDWNHLLEEGSTPEEAVAKLYLSLPKV